MPGNTIDQYKRIRTSFERTLSANPKVGVVVSRFTGTLYCDQTRHLSCQIISHITAGRNRQFFGSDSVDRTDYTVLLLFAVTDDNHIFQHFRTWKHLDCQYLFSLISDFLLFVAHIRENKYIAFCGFDGEVTVYIGDGADRGSFDFYLHPDHRLSVFIDYKPCRTLSLCINCVYSCQ